LVDAWKRFGDSPLRTNTKYLEAANNFPATWKIEMNGGVTKVFDGSGKELAELSEGLIKSKGGSTGSWNKLLNEWPIKNHEYKVDNYTFRTDELGRVSQAEGNLEFVTRARNQTQQGKAVDLKDGVKEQDDAGHLFASEFNGPGEQINYLPMRSNVNRAGGEWRKLEIEWENALKAGKEVKVEMKFLFGGNSKRPEFFQVNYWIDGKKTTAAFDN